MAFVSKALLSDTNIMQWLQKVFLYLWSIIRPAPFLDCPT